MGSCTLHDLLKTFMKLQFISRFAHPVDCSEGVDYRNVQNDWLKVA